MTFTVVIKRASGTVEKGTVGDKDSAMDLAKKAADVGLSAKKAGKPMDPQGVQVEDGDGTVVYIWANAPCMDVDFEDIDHNDAMAAELGLKNVVISLTNFPSTTALCKSIFTGTMVLKSYRVPDLVVGNPVGTSIADALIALDNHLEENPSDHVFFEGFLIKGNTIHFTMGS